QQRLQELKRIRQIGEGLSKALNLDQVIELLVNLIWETITLSIVGIKLMGWDNLPDKFACRLQPGLDMGIKRQFEDRMQQELLASRLETSPFKEISWSKKLEEHSIVFCSGSLNEQIESLIWSPLWVNQSLVGMLGLGQSEPGGDAGLWPGISLYSGRD
ncbi:MAG: hypothetical protein JRG72_10865, partial [Deltaproteobacteria bacterium]|nr:hypothetical protein [Deltaproteobacteria bacterium]